MKREQSAIIRRLTCYPVSIMSASALSRWRLLLTAAFWQRCAGFLHFTGRRFVDDRCLQIAGSLTYTSLLALVPLFTIALTVFSAFPRFEQYSAKFKLFLLSNLAPESAGKAISVYMRQFADNADRLTAMGTLVLALTAILLIFTIEKAFNQGIWRVQGQRKLLLRVLIYWAVLTLGPLLLGISLSQSAMLLGEVGLRVDWPVLGRLLDWLVAYGLGFAGFYVLYAVVPNCYVAPRHALLAAAAASLAFELMKGGFGWYIKQFGSFKLVYGAFASFPIFLLWLYLTWVVVLGGAVLAASLSYWRGDAWRRQSQPGQQFDDAVRLLLLLAEAHHEGHVLSLRQIQRRLPLGFDELNRLLERMAQRRWVQATRNDQWILSCDLAMIRLVDVYRLFIPMARLRADDALGQQLQACQQDIEHGLDKPLSALGAAL